MSDNTDSPLLTRDRWEQLIGTSFRVVDAAIEVLLAEVDGRSDLQFSLVFHGPADPVLAQGMRRLESDATEPMDIFVVPLGVDDLHASYEAVFSLRPPEPAPTP